MNEILCAMIIVIALILFMIAIMIAGIFAMIFVIYRAKTSMLKRLKKIVNEITRK